MVAVRQKVKALTRYDLDRLAAFLRARLSAPAGRLAPTTAAGCLRTVEQAVLGLEAYLQLAAHRPATSGLNEETQRARALWQTLLDMAALWPDHPDHPDRRARPAPSHSSPDPGPPSSTTAA